FKALLFLGAGSVIHALSGEQDIRRMGGIFQKIPFTYATMLIGTLAITGVPFFAGYYSKDAIIEALYSHESRQAYYAFIVGLIVVFLTAFYSWRLMITVFHQSMRSDEHVIAHLHEAPMSMKTPLMVLSVGAIIGGYLGQKWFVAQSNGFTWADSLVPFKETHHIPTYILYLPLALSVIGFLSAIMFYYFNIINSAAVKNRFPRVHALVYHKFYIDELYDMTLVQPIKRLGLLFMLNDHKVIDAFGPDGSAKIVGRIAHYVKCFATGRVYYTLSAFVLVLVVAFGITLLSIFYPLAFTYQFMGR
ncbi:MAG: proton-conducting transporter membrane subunit, partial [Alphaproteobacteria bacterium]|nr:proton-conducting transporter membrane subunit [Alphaproteobacteria bacterium]